MTAFLNHFCGSIVRAWPWVLVFLLAFSGVASMVGRFADQYVWTAMDSVPGTFFIKRPDLDVRRGHMVLVRRTDPLIPKNIRHLTKVALCMPGDELRRIGLIFVCNGRLISVAKSETQSGLPLEVFDWSGGPVPDGVFFAGSPHPDGYDSRYFGLVPLDRATVLEAIL